MRVAKTVIGLFGLGATISCAPAMQSGPEMGTMGMGRNMDLRVMDSWPKASREEAEFMMMKYGAPAEVTATKMTWGPTGQWNQTVVHNYEAQPGLPGSRSGVMQQWVNHRLPTDKVVARHRR